MNLHGQCLRGGPRITVSGSLHSHYWGRKGSSGFRTGSLPLLRLYIISLGPSTHCRVAIGQLGHVTQLLGDGYSALSPLPWVLPAAQDDKEPRGSLQQAWALPASLSTDPGTGPGSCDQLSSLNQGTPLLFRKDNHYNYENSERLG